METKKSKLILISHRLPVTIEKKNGVWIFKQSVGGLATGLSSFSDKNDFMWLGFCGITSESISDEEKEDIKEKLINDYNYYPIFLTADELKNYYDNFSNKTLWPLFHYFQAKMRFDEESWRVYQEVNAKFYEVALKISNPGDTFWIHDYHLFILPKLIKDSYPTSRIGFFLHIPFPSFEIFRLLPCRNEILEGLLGADLIGFHTFSYVRHFLSSVLRISGYENSFGNISINNRNIKADVFPMGIDFDKYNDSINKIKVKNEIKEITKKTKNHKIILSIDRLDYTKGIVNRLEAFDYFLAKYPEYIDKVELIMIAVPTRDKIESYKELKNQVDQIVGRINGKYSSIGWNPIWYIYSSLPFHTLTALYNVAEITLLTPLRDGMNLVAKEYVAAKNNKSGVLILSEMTGASEELGEAIIVNPYNIVQIADALHTALSMSQSEQSEKLKIMRERIKRNDVFKWASGFIEKLNEIKLYRDEYVDKNLNDESFKKITEDYKKGEKRLLLLDYDGTLTSIRQKPEDAKPDKELKIILQELIKDDKNKVVIISGRERGSLERWFSDLNINLVCEHGIWIKEAGGDWKKLFSIDNGWKDNIKPLLQLYVDRTPGSFIEEKDYSLAWHYRNADPEYAKMQKNELRDNLMIVVANLNLGIMEGKKVLEIKNLEVNKGKAVNYLINKESYNFILAIGDDVTDEDIFKALPNSAITIKVNSVETTAKYVLKSSVDVRALLKKLSGEDNE